MNNIETKPSILSVLSKTVSNAVKGTTDYALDVGSSALGYKKIQAPIQEPVVGNLLNNANQEVAKVIDNVNNNPAVEAAGNLLNNANQEVAKVINNVNKTITNTGTSETIENSLGKTVDIAKDVLEDVNAKLNDPELVETVADTTEKISKTAATILEATKPAIKQVIGQTAEIAEESLSKVGASGVNILLDTADAIPGVGSVVGIVRAVDKAVIAGSSVLEAGLKATTVFSDAFTNTIDKIKHITDSSRLIFKIQTLHQKCRLFLHQKCQLFLYLKCQNHLKAVLEKIKRQKKQKNI